MDSSIQAYCAYLSQKNPRLHSVQKYLAAQSVCFIFHIKSSLLLAWENIYINTAYLNAVEIVSSGAFKEKAEKQPWFAGFNDQNINSD